MGIHTWKDRQGRTDKGQEDCKPVSMGLLTD